MDSMEEIRFQNLQEKNMTFDLVFERILSFMQRNPIENYQLMIGTDSQVHVKQTNFITGIVIQDKGKGVWACIRKVIVPRKILHLHEKISYETTLTEEVVSLFTEERKSQLIDVVLPHVYQGATFTMEGHIDIGSGNRNKTKEFVNEMITRIESFGIEPKIKPDSFVASSYANKYTK